MMVLQLCLCLLVVFPLVFVGACDRNFRKMGCYGRSPDVFTELLITDLDPTHHNWGKDIDWTDFAGSLHSLACRCREKAYGKYQYFSLGFYGECYGASNAEVFQTGNESTACIDGSQYQCDKIVSKECVGVEDNEYVYEILQKPPPINPVKQTTFTCHSWTSEDLTKMGPRPSVATETNHCEKNLGFKFSHGDESKAPGCGTCWCCRPIKEDLEYDTPILFPTERDIKKNSLLTTISKLSATFIVKFQVKPTVFQAGWTNILHMSVTGYDMGVYGDRVPGVWFWSSSSKESVNRLHICSAVSNNRNYCYNTPKNIPKGQWTDVEISQRPEGSLYRYEVKIDNVLIGSVLNEAAAEFANVKVYVSDPWYNNVQGKIRKLSIVPGLKLKPTLSGSNALNFPQQRVLTKNLLLTTIPRLTKSYIVRFQINPTHFQAGWSSVIHFTSTGIDCCNNGDRIPAVWFYSALPDASVNRLHICSSVNNVGDYCYKSPDVKRGAWTPVEISQRHEGSFYKYEVKVNDTVVGSILNKNAKDFSQVKVFAADNWHNAQPGYIRGLTIIPQADPVLSGNSLQYQEKLPLARNVLLTTIPKLTSSYTVKFQINPSHFQYGWSNVLHFTATGNDCCSYGDRVPAVWFWSASPKDSVNKLHICSAVNNIGDFCYDTPKNVQVGVWTDVQVTQRKEGSFHRYTVKVGGAVTGTVLNKVPKEFSNVKVWVADNYHRAQPGYIQHLSIEPQVDG